jgi:hypothetical protein
MKRQPFEIALNDIAQLMCLSPIGLLQVAASLQRKSEEINVELPLTDEYIEEECAKATLAEQQNAGALEELLRDLLT